MKDCRWHLDEQVNTIVRIVLLFMLSLNLYPQTSKAQKMNVLTYNMRDGLSQMKVSALFEDSRGYIWVGTRNGLNRFDGANFQNISTTDGLINNRIIGIRENNEGELLILTAGGISIYNGSKFTNFPHNFPRVLYRLLQDDDGYLYVFGTALHGFHPERGIFEIHEDIHHFGYDSKSEKIIALTADSLYRVAAGTITQRESYNARQKFQASTLIDTEQILGESIVERDSLYTFSIEDKSWIPKGSLSHRRDDIPLPDYCRQNSLMLMSGGVYKLPLKGAFCMLRTKSNNYFIGTDEGLVRFMPTAFNEISNIDLPYVWSVIDSRDKIYFGNYGAGLIEMDKPTKVFQKINQSYDLFHCGASTNNKGDFYFSNNQGLTSLIDGKLQLTQIGMPVLFNIYDSQRKSVVLGVDFGLAIKDSTGHTTLKNQKGLFHDNHYIQSITIGPRSNYWCGSYSGLTKYNPDSESFEHFTSAQNNLPIGPGVFCGLRDDQNVLWLGGNNGICWYDENQDKLIKVNSPILNDQIKSVIELSPGILLLGTKNELLTFKSELYFDQSIVDIEFYNASNGYNGIEPGYTGFYKDEEQNIWITSSSHTSYLSNPYSLKENNILRAQILSVDDRPIPFAQKVDAVQLASNENIVINVEAVGLDRPSTVKYALRLDGGDWTGWQEENQFVIDKLKHGHHIVEVAAGPQSENMEGIALTHVIVALPLFQRDFFLPLLLMIIAAMFLYTFYLWWKRRLERQQYLMQVEESRYLRSQLLLSELNPHFIFNVLASIQNKILTGNKEEANHKLVQLSSLIRNFLTVSFKSNDPKNKLEHEITLDREIELLNSYLKFEQSNSNNHFEFTIHIHEDCEPTQIMIPPMLIQPFAENAVKHGVLPMSEKGLIELHFRYKENVLFCEILDNGRGIDNTKHQKLHKSHTSLGSKIVKERILALNQIGYQIDVEIEQRKTGGTAVRLIIQE